MGHLSRRQFLASTAAAGILGAVPSPLISGQPALALPATTIRVGNRVIEVNGRPATVFGLTQPDGSHGLIMESGKSFRVRLENQLEEETLIHWHGLTPPWQQDGVPHLSQSPLAPGATHDYDFPLTQPGTNWMHSHHGLQEQRLMAAPLIVRDSAGTSADIQEVVVLFHDFTFRDPDEILAGLKAGGHGVAGHGTAEHGPGLLRRLMESVMPMRGMHHGAGHGRMDHGAAGGAIMMHLHDVEYDAFLANDRTFHDPQVFRVERSGRVRLRLINGATATNFWLDLGRLEGRLIAVDGMPVVPVTGRRFEFATAQRLDIVLELPRGEGAWPIFAVREGEWARTGFLLATSGGKVEKVTGETQSAANPVGLALERRLQAAQPPEPRQPDRRHTVTITEGPGYVWMLNGAMHGGHTPLEVGVGERVEITFNDQTSMAHPMHLHGHHFQVVAINGERFAGALRDTVLVPARGSVTIAFDADNPGRWALHCHHLYHMAAGMMTTLEYRS
ncbi:MAG: multicopper oxidase family protein [Beijerinckiaceae bacterium]|nr:multicopper oxidase family protein [Beijerinckiaceae bacterium]